MRAAAETELTKATPRIDGEELLREMERAFEALSVLLGPGDGAGWFFGADRPGLFDAAVFAYVHLILRWDEMGWWADGERLVKAVRRRGNVVGHRERVLREFYEGS